MARENPRLLKGLLREIYLLLLALLAFINFFVPAMIHSVYSPDGTRIQNRVWVRVVPGNQFHSSLNVGEEIGLAVGDQKETFDCFKQGTSKDLTVTWGPAGQSVPITVAHQSQPLHIGAWLAAIPSAQAAKPEVAVHLRAPIRIVVFHERDSFEVDEEIRENRLAQHRLVLELSPGNGYQVEVPLPENLVAKQ